MEGEARLVDGELVRLQGVVGRVLVLLLERCELARRRAGGVRRTRREPLDDVARS